ncbi:MAG: hypothetical protein AAGC86_12270 [Pseudomonadota bacterium]
MLCFEQLACFRLASPPAERLVKGESPRVVPPMRFRRPQLLLLAICAAVAGCTPRDFPENPFTRAEQDLTAPDVLPLESGFPGAEDLAAAREAETEAFSLNEQAEALTERSTALTERDPALSGEQFAPSAPAEEVLERSESLRSRADALRAREDIGQPDETESLEQRRERVDEQAEILRTRTD